MVWMVSMEKLLSQMIPDSSLTALIAICRDDTCNLSAQFHNAVIGSRLVGMRQSVVKSIDLFNIRCKPGGGKLPSQVKAGLVQDDALADGALITEIFCANVL